MSHSCFVVALLSRQVRSQREWIAESCGPPKLASNSLAASIVERENSAPTPIKRKNPHAVALGRKGGLAGSTARAEALSAEERARIPEADALLRDCHQRNRYNIRRATNSGVEVTRMDIDRDFDEHYALYQHRRAFKRFAAQPYEVQRAALAPGVNRLLLVARHEGRMVGVSTFRFRRPGIIEYAANVSRREESKLKQNDLLVWRTIEWSTQQKDLQFFSMTGAHVFLQHFGGQRRAIYRHALDRLPFREHVLTEMCHAVVI